MRGVNITMVVMLALMVWAALLIADTLNDNPVVLKDPEGTVCGCIVPTDARYCIFPTEAACELVDLNKPHEVIHVSYCGQRKE